MRTIGRSYVWPRWPWRRVGARSYGGGKAPDDQHEGGPVIPPVQGETFYVISALDGAIAVANNGDRATHG